MLRTDTIFIMEVKHRQFSVLKRQQFKWAPKAFKRFFPPKYYKKYSPSEHGVTNRNKGRFVIAISSSREHSVPLDSVNISSSPGSPSHLYKAWKGSVHGVFSNVYTAWCNGEPGSVKQDYVDSEVSFGGRSLLSHLGVVHIFWCSI